MFWRKSPYAERDENAPGKSDNEPSDSATHFHCTSAIGRSSDISVTLSHFYNCFSNAHRRERRRIRLCCPKTRPSSEAPSTAPLIRILARHRQLAVSAGPELSPIQSSPVGRHSTPANATE